MLDIGFRDDIRNILSHALKGVRGAPPSRPGGFRRGGRPGDLPVEPPPVEADAPAGENGDGQVDQPPLPPVGHQTIFVSATFTDEIDRLARKYMREPVEKAGRPRRRRETDRGKGRTSLFLQRRRSWDKYRLLKGIAPASASNPQLAIVFCPHQARGRQARPAALTARRHRVPRNPRQPAPEPARQGDEELHDGGKFDVLVATDLASRGIDVAGASATSSTTTSPTTPRAYVHRVGRTARMGRRGQGVSRSSRPDQGEELTPDREPDQHDSSGT
ncbi:MAG: hypothetical protein KatS3mg104_2122 [Phycisphaerae bacterium]|nr:MAG: hypothetical protein KatS3mg104_2122 [Phycisphaerae bacterium]